MLFCEFTDVSKLGTPSKEIAVLEEKTTPKGWIVTLVKENVTINFGPYNSFRQALEQLMKLKAEGYSDDQIYVYERLDDGSN